jgi:hypothetical protein
MPRYQLSVDVPAQSDQSQAVVESIEVDERYVRQALRFAPPGSNNTVKAVLQSGDRPLLPTAESDPVVLTNNRTFAPVQARLPGAPNDLTVRAWAPDADFPHTVTVFVDVVELARASPLQRIANRLSRDTGGIRPLSGPPEG